MMRAVRFASQLDFKIEDETLAGISKHSELLEKIAVERSHTEFVKMMLGVDAENGLNIMLEQIVSACSSIGAILAAATTNRCQ